MNLILEASLNNEKKYQCTKRECQVCEYSSMNGANSVSCEVFPSVIAEIRTKATYTHLK
jgi:hypothetical protein